jgi:hypothetical protein
MHLGSMKAEFLHIVPICATLYINAHKKQMADDSISADMALLCLG